MPCCHHNSSPHGYSLFRWPGTFFIQLRQPGRVDAAQSLKPGAQVWILTPLRVFRRSSCLISLNHNSFTCKRGARETGVMHFTGPLWLLFLMTYEVMAPVVILQTRKLNLRWGTFLWSQSCHVGWSAVLGPFHQTTKLSPLSTFYTGNATLGHICGCPAWLAWAATTFPKQLWTSQCLF